MGSFLLIMAAMAELSNLYQTFLYSLTDVQYE